MYQQCFKTSSTKISYSSATKYATAVLLPQNIGFLFTFQHFVEGQTVRERKTQQIKKQQKTNFLSKPILRRKKKLTAELLSFLRFYEAQILGLEPFLI